MERECQLIVPQEEAGKRLDNFVSDALPEITRSAVQRLCAEGMLLVNGCARQKSHRVCGGELVTLTLPMPKPSSVVAQDIPLDITYEDSDLLVVNKPRGLVVHPAPGNEDGTLVNALLYHCADGLGGIGGVMRPGIVHRIDKMTSGLLVVAKHDRAHEILAEQVKAHSFTRIYEAVAHGTFRDDEGVIDAPIGRHPTDRKRMWITPGGGRDALTRYRILARYTGFTHLELRLETGRTHQIRVHLASRGHPVAGDVVYGPKNGVRQLEGQCLHARTLGFVHPRSGEYLEFSSPLPEYFRDFLSSLRGAGD